MLTLVVKATAILLAGAGITALMRRSSAASRHVVWTNVILATLLLPMTSLLVRTLPATPLEFNVPTPRFVSSTATSDLSANGSTAPTALPDVSAGRLVPGRWLPIISGLWLTGMALLLLQSGRAIWTRRRLVTRSSRCVDNAILARVQALRSQLGIHRHVTVLISPCETMPATWGITAPRLLLPPSASAWSRARLDLVLIHELAHVARFDALSHGIARLGVALLWWNPLMWLATRRAHVERELACDNAVLRMGVPSSHYAEELLAIAQSQPVPFSDAVALTMARAPRLGHRVSAILSVNTSRADTTPISLALAFGIVLTSVPLAAAHFVPAARALTPGAVGAVPVEASVSAVAGASGLASPAATTRTHTDFSGTWIAAQPTVVAELFDVGISDVRSTMTISQTESAVTVLRELPPDLVSARRAIVGEDPTRTVYPFDGRLARFDGDRLILTNTSNGKELPATYAMQGSTLAVRFPNTARALLFNRAATVSAQQSGASPARITEGFGSGAYRVGGALKPPTRLAEVKPLYTPAAKRARIEGTVELEAIVGADGAVTDVRVTKSLDTVFGLDTEALNVVRRTRFSPATLNGKPVPVLVTFELMFTLRDEAARVPADTFGAGAYVIDGRSALVPPVRRSLVKPTYTPEALRAKIEGIVELEAIVDVNGHVSEVRVTKSLDTEFGLDAEAIKAVQATTYTPATLDGKPVPCRIVVELRFTVR
jgi:TonB family protein